MGGFLNKTREHLTNVAHQLFDGIGKRISLNLMSVCQMERLAHTEDGGTQSEIEIHTHNTKFESFISRNQINEKCDNVVRMLLGKMMIPQGKSGLSFKEGVLIRIEYYANLSND